MIWMRYCSLSIAAISILTAAPNIYMVIQINKYEDSQSIGAGRMFRLIGVSNVACALITGIHMFMIVSAPIPLKWFVAGCTIASFLHQLGFNVSLAYERLQVITHGFEYHSSDARNSLERKLSICVFTSSLIIGLSSSTLRFIFGNVMFLLIPQATTRILGYIALSVIYVKLYFAIKSHNQTIAVNAAERGQASAINNQIITRRLKRLGHVKMFFIGITSSFFISNLPSMITFLVIDKTPVCNTVDGIVSSISVSLSLLGMAFDAVWFYYMKRRSRLS